MIYESENDTANAYIYIEPTEHCVSFEMVKGPSPLRKGM